MVYGRGTLFPNSESRKSLIAIAKKSNRRHADFVVCYRISKAAPLIPVFHTLICQASLTESLGRLLRMASISPVKSPVMCIFDPTVSL